MKAFALLLIVAMLLAPTAHIRAQKPQQSTVSGRVADKAEAAPIPHAIVFVHVGQGRIVSAKVDSQGRFAIPLAPGFYDIFFAAPGFSPTCQRLKLAANEQKHLEPRLGPSLETMEDQNRP